MRGRYVIHSSYVQAVCAFRRVVIAALPSDRLKGAAGALLVQGALLWVLIVGLAVGGGQIAHDKMDVFAIAPDAPQPPPVPPPARHSARREGAASPVNIRSTAAEVVAPKPVLPPPPQPIAAAPVANVGVRSAQGAAPGAGPGNGAGGDGRDTGPRRIGGRIKPGDLPDDRVFLLQSGRDYTVGGKYAIEEDGRVDECRITRSSGNAELDRLTCDLIERKFKYRPAFAEDHVPFKAYIVENHSRNFEDTGPRRR